MNVIFLEVAACVIRVHFKPSKDWEFQMQLLKKEIQESYKGFLREKPQKVDLYLEIEDVMDYEIVSRDSEKKNYIILYKDSAENKIITFPYISMLQFEFILRILLYRFLLTHNGIPLHTSAVAINGKACLFLGRSGSGKSTAMKLLSKKYTPLADDSGIITYENNNFYFYQTPFIEKQWWVKKNATEICTWKNFSPQTGKIL